MAYGPVLAEPLLSGLTEFIAERTGLHFPRERWRDLERALGPAARELGFADAEACSHWLLSEAPTQGQIEVLASHLTVGETYFFRDRGSFEALEERVLPELLRLRGAERRLRVWSAGCCTGEEPYSIALLLDRLIPDYGDWSITLLATDINPRFLRKAAEGVYGEWSFRDAPAWIRRHFERRKDRRFELKPRIRARVTFSCLNLADDAYPSLATNTNAMDVILCRNVLMYFTPERAARVVENLRRALVEGGWLIVSPTEISHTLFSSFAAVEIPGAVLYRKLAGAAPRVLAAERPAPILAPARDEVPRHFAAALTVHEELPAQARPSEPEPSEAGESAMLSRAARDCADQGKLAEALAWCEKAVAADKLDPALHYLLATILQEQGEAEAAADALRRALYLDPEFALAHFALGNLRLAQGRRPEAQRHFANALALLRARPHGEILPQSEGLTAGRLAEIVASVLASQPRAAA